jgi:NADPH2:quinone reductase
MAEHDFQHTWGIRFHETGGPEVLRWESFALRPPAPDEVLLAQTAIGLNFIDIYHRTGLYAVASLPASPGTEAAGTIVAMGAAVPELAPELRVGQRVAYAHAVPGAYVQHRSVPAARCVPLPEDVTDEVAAATLIKGLTAEYLVRRLHDVKAGETVLVHAAAGGVGSWLVPWAASLGARVIGTVGREAKVERAKALGCDEVIVLDRGEVDFASQVRTLTDGRGVDVVYDSIGGDVFHRSLDCVAPRGLVVAYGQSSGEAPKIDVGVLAAKGSLFLTRPTLFGWTRTRDELLASAEAAFEICRRGIVDPTPTQRWPLHEAAAAQVALASRATVGASVLLP